jgi:hypothetical protein
MPGYIQDKILSEEEISEAIELANSLDWHDVFQMYNLFDVQRADVKDRENGKYGFADTLQRYSRLPNMIGFYFLRYVPGSFARMHHDNNTDLTIVTLLEDEGLVGGHSIVTEIYNQKPRPSDQTCARSNNEIENPPYGKDIIVDVLPMERGDSLVYGPDQRHGVSKVYEGSRLVLINWFNKDPR